jgi:hypothetical protein
MVLLAGMNLRQPSAFAQSEDQRILNAYFNAGYGYCDAQMLGEFWGLNPVQAKMLAGKGLLGYRGFARNIPSKLTAARRQYAGRGVCNYNSDFSYEDAVALAAYWKTSVATAKASLTNKLESGNLPLAKQVVSEARQAAKRSQGRSSSAQTASYRLQTMFTGTGKCLDIVNDGRNDRLNMADCGNFSGQFWQILPSQKPGYYRLQTMFTGTGKCLDIVNDGRNDRLNMADCGNFSGQFWQILPSQKPGHSRLKTMFTGTGKCLDIVNDGRNNRLNMGDCGDFSGQYWRVTKNR